MLGDAERAAAAAVLEGDILTHGPRVKEFEAAFAEFTGAPHAIATATCMAALHLASWAFELGPGDEVLVPAQTHVAGAHAVEVTGARPVFVDADPRTGNMDLTSSRASSASARRAISVVHYLGLPLDMGPRARAGRSATGCSWWRTARSRSAPTIDGTHVGLLGDIGCFSFYPVKHITTGEGGMVITRHDDVADRVGKQRAFGIDKSVLADRRHTGAYEIERLGLNYRLGEVGRRDRRRAAAAAARVPRGARAQLRRAPRGAWRTSRACACSTRATTAHARSSHYCLSAVLDDELGDAARAHHRRAQGQGHRHQRLLSEIASGHALLPGDLRLRRGLLSGGDTDQHAVDRVPGRPPPAGRRHRFHDRQTFAT